MPHDNPVHRAARLGQSFWFDGLDRNLLASGGLTRMVERDGLRGVTTNATTFAAAMTGDGLYRPSLPGLWARGITDPRVLYEALAIDDLRSAADLLHRFWHDSAGLDGYVSWQAAPHLAQDGEATLAEARRLFAEVARDNVMVEVPGTPQGIAAIERLVEEGINVNVTLLYRLGAYQDCAEAYLAGLERRAAAGGDLRRVASVASFSLSDIDDAVDRQITTVLSTTPLPDRRTMLGGLLGTVAIASAKRAYQHFRQLLNTPRWQALARRGAHPQRLLWARTAPGNPAWSRGYYVDALVGGNCISAVPADIWQQFLDQGDPRTTVAEGLGEAEETMRALPQVGISLDDIGEQLLEDGITGFTRSWVELLGWLERERHSAIEASAFHP